MSLQPGVYTLETPVTNPNSDRRYRNDFTAVVEFPAGLYTVKEYPLSPDHVQLVIGKVGSYGYLRPGIPEYDLLASALVPATPSVATVAAMTDLEDLALDVLQILVTSGKISLADIESATAQALDSIEEV